MQQENTITSGKDRLLEILSLLYEKSDENHQLSTNDILNHLQNKGMLTNRKTVKNDIEILNKHGIDIVITHGLSNTYFMGDRIFQMPEIKMLMDSVMSSRAITEHKSEVLIDKLKSLVSVHQAAELSESMCFKSAIKSSNENIYYIVDTIHNAIKLNKKIQFRKYDYNVLKERTYRDNGKLYVVSPYELVWFEDRYYLIGFFEDSGLVSSTRVDNIEMPSILLEDSHAIPSWFDMGEYVLSMFKMYAGPMSEVELICENSMMRIILDRFGKNVETSVINEEHFKVKVTVSISPTFYGWVFQFGGMIRISSPKTVCDEYLNMIEQNLKFSTADKGRKQ